MHLAALLLPKRKRKREDYAFGPGHLFAVSLSLLACHFGFIICGLYHGGQKADRIIIMCVCTGCCFSSPLNASLYPLNTHKAEWASCDDSAAEATENQFSSLSVAQFYLERNLFLIWSTLLDEWMMWTSWRNCIFSPFFFLSSPPKKAKKENRVWAIFTEEVRPTQSRWSHRQNVLCRTRKNIIYGI